MKNKLKLTILGTALCAAFAANAGLEIKIKASETHKKHLVLGNFFDQELKEKMASTLSIFNNVSLETSNKMCKDVELSLDTSYYCIDVAKNSKGLIEASLKEKFAQTVHKEVNFYQGGESYDKDKASIDLSDSLYKSIFGKGTVLNSKLAYVQRKDLRNGNKIFNLKVSDYQGKNAITLLASPQPILSIDWSPDNSKLAYVSYEKVRSSVFIHDLKTGARKRVTTFKGINAFPSWSPSGDLIALSLSKDGSSDIYIFDNKANSLKKITSFNYEAAEPVWISENEIAFTSDKTGNPFIYALDLKTKRMKPLSKNYLYTTSAKASNDMQTLYGIYSKGGSAGILSIDKNSRNEKVLIKDFFAESPSVGKGDETIIYSTKENGKSILRAVDLKGDVMYEIESTGTNLKEPSYSN